MASTSNKLLAVAIASILAAACGGGSSDSAGNSSTAGSQPAAAQSGNLALTMSDASTEDWATIGVKVLSIALVPQSGGANVMVYTAASPAPMVNLVQLDQISEILGNISVPVGTYTSAVMTVSANPGDVVLTAAADPEVGFAAAPGSTIPTAQIQIQHTQGASGSLTVPVTVNFVSPLVVSASASNSLDLEFDLAHPAFIVGHVPPTSGGATLWAVNFDGPVRHHPVHDLAWLVLRHMYGDVSAISSDNSSITISKELPTEPAVNPETAMSTGQSLQILADATNGTIFYDVDAKTQTVIKDFTTESSLATKSVRVAARYQEDGTLVATRIWASSSFNNVWISPEGHVLHVDANSDVIGVADESGGVVDLVVDSGTQFFLRQPQNPGADSAPIATGTAFLTNKDLVRGFKIHASVVDPLATPLVAQTVDIEVAKYDGTISAANSTNFTYTRAFRTTSDDYQVQLDYISSMTDNGFDARGNAIEGYKFWNFAYPTLITSGTAAIPDFIADTNGSVNFGGTVGVVASRGVSGMIWNDPANAGAWSAAATILTPSRLPLGSVSTAYANNSFAMTVLDGSNPATVSVSTTSGSATLVYQVDRTNGVLTVSPIDVTTSTGLSALSAGLATGAKVKVYGIPQAGGILKAYVIAYFTGDAPAQ